MSENDFSARIRDLRAKHNLTLEQVAQRVGVGRSTVRKWETGMIENLRRDKIAKLAAALHTTPAYLMGWDDCDAGLEPNLLAKQTGYWDGKRLSEERIARGFSVSRVSSELKISEDEYMSLENGETEPSFILLLRMANIFGYDLDYLCHRTAKGSNLSRQYIEDKLALVNQSSAFFTEDEISLIRKFRCLDDRGQAAVLNVLNHEYDSLPGEKTNPAPKEA